MSDWRQEMLLTSEEVARLRDAYRFALPASTSGPSDDYSRPAIFTVGLPREPAANRLRSASL